MVVCSFNKDQRATSHHTRFVHMPCCDKSPALRAPPFDKGGKGDFAIDCKRKFTNVMCFDLVFSDRLVCVLLRVRADVLGIRPDGRKHLQAGCFEPLADD
jgi:hypothetical protein